MMSNLSSKASSRITLNTRLLAIVVGIFFLTLSLKSELLLQKVVLIQLVLSIPLLFTSTLAYSKIGYRKKTERWNLLGWVTFIFGYAFVLNVIGILVGRIVGLLISIIFFVSSWILMLIYSFIDISYNKSVCRERLVKDALFILIQVFLGVAVVLGFI